MSEATQSPTAPIRRVVVALDASPCSRVVLRTAARIAAGLGAQLEGLYVEDARLLNLAELPIAAELRQPGGLRAFHREVAERELRVVAQTVERWAGEIARRHSPDWHFRVLRGYVAQALMDAADDQTLLSLGRFGKPLTPSPSRIGSVARQVLGAHRAPLLLTHQEIRPGQPILVTTSGDTAELPLLAMAVRLAQVYNSPLIVLAETPEAETFLAAALADLPQEVTIRRLIPGNLSGQILALSQGKGGVVLSHRRDDSLAELECALILL